MSVEVKTPNHTQFEHVEFQCGEKQPNSSAFHRPDGGGSDSTRTSENKMEPNEESNTANSKSGKQVTIFENQKNDGWRQESSKYLQKRRRCMSSSSATRGQASGFRKRRYSAKEKIVLPTKFLLGGNIRDPLNLNSLYDDETGLMLNEKTPNSSPLPFPVHRENRNFVIPPNITDPLNLNSGEDVDEYALRGMARKRRRHKHRKKLDEDATCVSAATTGKESEKKKNLTLALKIEIDTEQHVSEERADSDSEIMLNQRRCDDKIVSPVIPQSFKSRKRRRTISECNKPDFLEGLGTARRALLRTESVPIDHDLLPHFGEPAVKKMKRQTSGGKVPPPQQKLQVQTHPDRKQKNSNTHKKFIYGNYNRYYGYRNPELEEDTRLSVFRSEWFEAKDVLDIGCNVGHVTLSVAKMFKPKKIIGMDIDGRLISAARKNIRYYLTASAVKTDKYPLSAKLNYGPIAAPSVNADKSYQFPNNMMFLQGNYVLEYDELLDVQKEDYDVIMALSITKWIHLNFGDAGMKRFFKRIFKQLRPGGRLILEPQAWPSYKKKKKLNETIFSNFQSIMFKPDQFTDYLLSKEIGFSTCEAIEVPFNKSAGFRRPIQVFTKPDTLMNSPNPGHLDRDVPVAQKPQTRTCHTNIQPSEMSSCKVEPSSPECGERCQTENVPISQGEKDSMSVSNVELKCKPEQLSQSSSNEQKSSCSSSVVDSEHNSTTQRENFDLKTLKEASKSKEDGKDKSKSAPLS